MKIITNKIFHFNTTQYNKITIINKSNLKKWTKNAMHLWSIFTIIVQASLVTYTFINLYLKKYICVYIYATHTVVYDQKETLGLIHETHKQNEFLCKSAIKTFIKWMQQLTNEWVQSHFINFVCVSWISATKLWTT